MDRPSAESTGKEPPPAVARPSEGAGRWVRRLRSWALAGGFLAICGVTLALGTRWISDPLREGRDAYAAGNYRRALQVAQQILKEQPHHPHAALLAARSLTRLGFLSQAEEHYRRADSLPLERDDLHDRAYALARGDQPQRAIELYQEILARWPEDLLALKRLSAAYMAQARFKPVVGLAERLMAIPGGQTDGATLAAIAHHELRHPEQAAAAGLRVLEIDPELKAMLLPRGLFWNNLALDLIGLGRAAEAEALLARAVEGTGDANLMELLGLACLHQGKADQAESYWRQALQWDANNANALLGLGRLALNRNRPREALPWLQRAVEASPQALEPAYNLARAHRLLGQLAEAQHYEQLAAGLRARRPLVGGMGEMPDRSEPTDPTSGRFLERPQ